MTWNRAQDPGIPLLASVYILSRPVATVFHRDGVPGIRLSDELMAWVERQAASADKGRGAFLELAAKQVAVVRGLGYAGAYLAGQRSSHEIDTILRLADGYAGDWQALLPEVHWPEPAPHRLFERGEVPQLSSDRPTRPTRTRRVPLAYRFNRFVHDVAFDPESRGFGVARGIYRRLDGTPLMWPAHVLEQAVKVPLFDCKDCGDCSLPDIAYQCPEGACAKNQRNGPCGGSIEGECEVPGRRCVWTEAYDRLRPYGEAMTMLEREPVLQDNALRGSSAWANTYLGRDHYRHHTGGGS
jgi:methylenetetrahydrofolate reductase (NADPH)